MALPSSLPFLNCKNGMYTLKKESIEEYRAEIKNSQIPPQRY